MGNKYEYDEKYLKNPEFYTSNIIDSHGSKYGYNGQHFNFKSIEDAIATCKNPVLKIPNTILNLLIYDGRLYTRNPYPLRKSNMKYDFYGDMIDVDILKIDYKDSIDAIIVLDREDKYNFTIIHR